jgi:outer membrane protein TolC
MKFIITLLLFCSSLLCANDLTLEECIHQARDYSKKIKAMRAQVDIAEAIKNERRSLLLPHLDVEGRYEMKNSGRDYSVFTAFGSAFSNKTIGLKGQVLLFDFFSSWNIFKASTLEIDVAQKNLDKFLLTVDEEVKAVYFRILQSSKWIDVIKDSIHTLELQLKRADNFYSQGVVSKTDVLSVRVKLTEQKKNLLKVKNDKIEAQISLNRLLGNSLLSPLRLKDLPMGEHIKLSFEKLQKMALENRSDLKAMKAHIASLELLRKSARSAYAPKFFLFGGYSYLDNAPPSNNITEKPDKNWISGGVGVTIPLYDGGKTQADGQKIRAQLAEAKAHMEDLENTILMEVDQIYLKCEELFENVAIDEKEIRLAEENLKAMTERYGHGLVSMNDLLISEEQLRQARMNKNKTIYQYHTTYARLITALGGNG